MNKIVPLITQQRILDENILVTSFNKLFFTLNCLKLHFNYQYTLLSCISGIDLLSTTYRFIIAYDLLSLVYNSRIRIKILINEITPVISVWKLYTNSNWWEREIWDMFGIFFNTHPDLRRILTDYGFDSNPMKKDFPLYGFIELRFDDNLKRVVGEPLELTQELRYFTFQSPWSN